MGKPPNSQTSSLTRRPKQPAPPPPVSQNFTPAALSKPAVVGATDSKMQDQQPKTPPDDPTPAPDVVPKRSHRKAESTGSSANNCSNAAGSTFDSAADTYIKSGSVGRTGGDFSIGNDFSPYKMSCV